MPRVYGTQEVPSKGGYGVFAVADIPHGTLILSEKSILILPSDLSSVPSQVHNAFLALSQDSREKFLNLVRTEAKKQKYLQEAQTNNASNWDAEALQQAATVTAIVNTNAFAVGDDKKGGALWAAVGLAVSRVNHSCLPNAYHEWDVETRTHNVYAAADIPVGDEITLAYIPVFWSREARMRELRKKYEFECNCKACDLGTDFGVQSEKRRLRMQTLSERAKKAHEAGEYADNVEDFQALLELVKKEGLLSDWEQTV